MSRTGRVLTNRNCATAAPRENVGSAAKPPRPIPSRSASIGRALATNSGPMIARSRAPRPSNRSPGSGSRRRISRGAAGSLRSVSVKPVPGAVIASRRTTSPIACASARSVRRNFSRAGVAVNRPSSSTTVPRASAAGRAGETAPPRTRHRRALRRARGPRGHGQPADRAERRQRLAAKAEGQDVREVGAVDLRGRVPLERQRQLGRRDAVAVVLHPDQPLAAIGEGDVDAPRPGVERVLDQLLHRRRRPLHHLARRDPIGGGGVELADRATILAYLVVDGVHAASYSMRGRPDATDSSDGCGGYCLSAAGGTAGCRTPWSRS